jgi:hypothetical protein
MEIAQQLASAAQTNKCGVLTLGALHMMLQAMKGGSDCLSASLLEMAQQYGSTFSCPEKQDCMVQEENTHNKQNHTLTMAVVINPPTAVKQNNKVPQKRLKLRVENLLYASKAANSKEKKCSFCKQMGHNKGTCSSTKTIGLESKNPTELVQKLYLISGEEIELGQMQILSEVPCGTKSMCVNGVVVSRTTAKKAICATLYGDGGVRLLGYKSSEYYFEMECATDWMISSKQKSYAYVFTRNGLE